MMRNCDATRKFGAGMLLVACLAAMPVPVQAQEDYLEEAGFGILAALVDVVYMPTKVVYAGLGALVGGIAYVTTGGDLDAATAVWGPPLGGTYVVTGRMLRGNDPIHFVGRRRCRSCDAESDEPQGIHAERSVWTEEPLP